jgi:hypothetical protein
LNPDFSFGFWIGFFGNEGTGLYTGLGLGLPASPGVKNGCPNPIEAGPSLIGL